MKKTLLFLILGISFFGLFAQQSTNLIIQKSSPTIYLKGSGGVIDWNNADVTWTLTSNMITMRGGNFNLVSNSIYGTGQNGLSSSRWSKVWALDGDFTNPISINGAPIDAIYLKIFNPVVTGTSLTLPGNPINANDAANKAYVDAAVTLGVVWKAPAEDIVSTLPSGKALGLRYIYSVDNHIYTSDGDNTWTDGGASTAGDACYVKSDIGIPINFVGQYNYSGTAWNFIGTGVGTHNDLSGLQGGGGSSEYYHLTLPQWTISTQSATASRSGYLTSTDWTTFNAKANINNTTFTGTTTGASFVGPLVGNVTGNASTATSVATLTTPRNIYGNAFNGSANLAQIIASTYGGTGNGFFKVSGPASSEKTFIFPNINATMMSQQMTTDTLAARLASATDISSVISLTPLSSAPTPATEGMIYCGTNHHLYYYDGTQWQLVK